MEAPQGLLRVLGLRAARFPSRWLRYPPAHGSLVLVGLGERLEVRRECLCEHAVAREGSRAKAQHRVQARSGPIRLDVDGDVAFFAAQRPHDVRSVVAVGRIYLVSTPTPAVRRSLNAAASSCIIASPLRRTIADKIVRPRLAEHEVSLHGAVPCDACGSGRFTVGEDRFRGRAVARADATHGRQSCRYHWTPEGRRQAERMRP